MKGKVEIFYSYSHRDEGLRYELEKHLKNLRRQGFAIGWHDRKIGAGKEWEREIDNHLNTAQIILLLVSSDFMASDYCYDVEVKRAMERHYAGEARVIPVILRQVYWEGALFGGLQALPTDGKPVTSWHNLDEAFFDVTEGIRKVVDELGKKPLEAPASIQSQGIVEKSSDTNRLYNALLKLDYKEQVRIFRTFVEQKHQVGAFLIHGEPEYGQNWLLHRLLKQFPHSPADKVFIFNFQRMGRGRSLEALWRELGNWSGLKNVHSPQKIVEQISGLCQTQTIILVLRNLSVVDEQYIEKLLQDFWLPLAEMVRNFPHQSSKYYLLMFLVDNDGCIDKWNVPCSMQLDLSWKPHVPIKLEKLVRFPNDVLISWIEHEIDVLPMYLNAQNILENSEGGIPELVLEHICALCGCDWYEREKIWTKY